MGRNGLILILFIAQICAGAESVQVLSYEQTADNTWLRPVFRITNTGTTTINLSNIAIDYYFYEEGISSSNIDGAVWNFQKNGDVLPLTEISFTATSFSPPYTSGTKKANFRVRFTCNVNTRTLAPNDYIDLSVGIYRTGYVAMIKTDDYSYNGATTYQENNDIVISLSGNIIAGTAPSGGSSVVKVPMKWTGAYTTAPVPEEGDVYFNNTDKKAYVYSNSAWNFLSSGIWQSETNGISYKAGTVTTAKIVSDRVEVKEVVVTPKWQISNTPPDYVFEKDYKLTSLQNVEKYINENGHLSDMPSAKEFQKDGVNLVEMNMKLLKKVEELTLYTIELNKKIETVSDSLQNVLKKVNR